jgi:spermidine synthase
VGNVRFPPVARIRLAALGLCGAAFQTLLAREFLSTFVGNEAALAAFLGAWLFWGALGALAGRGRAGDARAVVGLGLFGLLGAGTLAAIRVLPAAFPAGAAPGLGSALLWAAILLGPVCLLGGFCFAALSGPDDGGGAYVAESVGAAVAGASLSLIVLAHAAPFTVAGALVVASGAAAWSPRSRAASLALAASFLAGVVLMAFQVGARALAAQGAFLRSAEELPSEYGSLVVGRDGGQVTVYADRQPVVSGSDPASAEECAHLPLALHPAPRSVAVLGVTPLGTTERLFAHGVERVDWLVEDGALVPLLRAEDPGLSDPRVRASAGDIRRSLASRPAAFDVIVAVSPEPSSAQGNRLFTEEFFRVAHAALRPGGVFALSLPGQNDYEAPDKRRFHSSVRRTLERVFGDVRLLPAERALYLARSGAPLPDETEAPAIVTAAFAARGIVPGHLNRGVLDDLLSRRRVEDARRWSSLGEPVNRDLNPTTYRLALDSVLAELGDAGAATLGLVAVALLAGALLVFAPRSRPIELAVFTSGASALASELVLMLAYQVASGALYREMGLFLSGFMTGAAVGAGWARGRPPGRTVLATDLLQCALALAFALAVPHALALPSWSVRVAAFLAAGVAGALPGAQFAAAARDVQAGRLWAADLLGAGMASLITLTFLVPWLGLDGTLLACAAMKLGSAGIVALPRRVVAAAASRPVPLLPLALGAFVVLAAGASSYGPLYAFTFQRPYQALALGVLLAGMLAPFEPPLLRELRLSVARRLSRLRHRLAAGAGRIVELVILLPVAGFPIARCYFDVPYVFCHVCPRPCVFGVLRPYLVPAALIANLHGRRFCEHACPLGTVQAACERLRARRVPRVPAAAWLRIAALVLVAIAYVVARGEREEGVQGSGLYALVYHNAYAPAFWTLAGAWGLVVLSLVVRRPFCDRLCPIGAASDAIARIEVGLAGRSGRNDRRGRVALPLVRDGEEPER